MYYNLIIKNKHGSISAGSLSRVKLTSVDGVGLPQKTSTSVTFANSPGAFTTSVVDSYRTITIAGDFYGDRNDVRGIYKILYDECTLQFINGTEHRQIKGRCLNPDDITKVGGGIWKFVFQFRCDDPYFYDFHDNKIGVFKRTDLWPNETDDDGNAFVLLGESGAIATERTSETDVINCGDLEIYPTITVTNTGGGGSENDELMIKNTTTHTFVKIQHAFKPGETVTFNLADREVVSSEDGEITTKITNDTRLDRFLLELGTNHISVSTNSNSALELTCMLIYRNKFLSAVI